VKKNRELNNEGQKNVINKCCNEMKWKLEKMEAEIGSARYYNARLLKRKSIIDEAIQIYQKDKIKTEILVSAIDRFSRHEKWYNDFTEKYPFINIRSVRQFNLTDNEKKIKVKEAEQELIYLDKLKERVAIKRTIKEEEDRKLQEEKLKRAINKVIRHMDIFNNSKGIYEDTITASFDIETTNDGDGDSRKNIKIISLVTDINKYYLFVNTNENLNEEMKKHRKIKNLEIIFGRKEKDIIESFFTKLQDLLEEKEALILLGYNTENFDWRVITDRTEQLGIDINDYKIENLKNIDYYKYAGRTSFTINGKAPNLDTFYKLVKEKEIETPKLSSQSNSSSSETEKSDESDASQIDMEDIEKIERKKILCLVEK